MRPLGSKENRRKTLITIMSITVHPNPMALVIQWMLRFQWVLMNHCWDIDNCWKDLDHCSAVNPSRSIPMSKFPLFNFPPPNANPTQSNDNPMVPLMITVHCPATWCLRGIVPSRSAELCRPVIGDDIDHTRAILTISNHDWEKSVYLPCSQGKVKHQEQHLGSYYGGFTS